MASPLPTASPDLGAPPAPALTWALTYRANHSRPFPLSLLQYSPNLAFSSWSKSSLKKRTEGGKNLSILWNKKGYSRERGKRGTPAEYSCLTYFSSPHPPGNPLKETCYFYFKGEKTGLENQRSWGVNGGSIPDPAPLSSCPQLGAQALTRLTSPFSEGLVLSSSH